MSFSVGFSGIRKVYRYFIIQSRLLFMWWLFKVAKNWVILNRIHRSLRPAIWRFTGCSIGNNVSIGYDVYYDVSNSRLIEIEDNVWITSRCLLLCHKRDISNYYIGDNINDMPYIKSKILIKRGAHIGMGTILMPGITIGEGSIIGAGSVVVKDVPAWSVAVGNPARVIKSIVSKS